MISGRYKEKLSIRKKNKKTFVYISNERNPLQKTLHSHNHNLW